MAPRINARHITCPGCQEEVFMEELVGGRCPLCGCGAGRERRVLRGVRGAPRPLGPYLARVPGPSSSGSSKPWGRARSRPSTSSRSAMIPSAVGPSYPEGTPYSIEDPPDHQGQDPPQAVQPLPEDLPPRGEETRHRRPGAHRPGDLLHLPVVLIRRCGRGG